MTIKQFAESRGVSKQLVYQNIKGAGKQVSELTDGKGNLTDSGLDFLQSIIPDKSSETEQSSGSQEVKQQKKESEIERLTRQNEMLLENVNSLTDTIKGLREDLSKAQKIADQAQQLHAIDKQRIMDLTKKLEAGSAEEKSDAQPVPAEEPKPEESAADQTEDTSTPAGESPEEKKQDPAKREGESADKPSSPVTKEEPTEKKQEPESAKKATMKQRLRILFTGK